MSTRAHHPQVRSHELRLGSDDAVTKLRAAAEPTRLRIMALLATVELSVKDLTQVLGQSQPRISRHLKLLAEAGLIARYREGAWVNLRIADASADDGLAALIVSLLDPTDSTFQRDRERAAALVDERRKAAEAYFADHAGEWDGIRSLHVDEAKVEAAMRAALGAGPFEVFLDVGTGTGRILELFADRYEKGVGIDSNPAMLAYARSRIEASSLGHAQVRHGDLYNIGLRDDSCDAIVVHQVLHFLTDPRTALAELARVLRPGGRLLIVDLAPHELGLLRDRYAHQRLGIADQELAGWLEAAGLSITDRAILAPGPGTKGDALTVNLWLAQSAVGTAGGASRLMETAG